jgi:hypothetical protein
MSQDNILWLVHHKDAVLPPICLCDTTNSSNKKTHWSAKELHCAMGCRKFKNYKHLLLVSHDSQWVNEGKFPLSLGSFATVPKGNKGKPVDQTLYLYLDVVHVDIAFGDCVLVGGFQYALILVDQATCYNWFFDLKDLSSVSILGAFHLFRALAGLLAQCFCSDCDLKLFGTAIWEYLIDNSSKIIAAPAGRQSSNGLVELHWKAMVHMTHDYLTEKQMPWMFWFFAITHAAQMMNAIPCKVHGHLASPFLLVHGVGHNERMWIPLFLLCFFHHDKDGTIKRSKHQAHTMDGIVIGCSPTSNALMVYNPPNMQYYEADSYRMDSYCLPTLVYPDVKYDGSLFCYLLCDDNPSMEQKYPPGTRGERIDSSTNILVAGTVMDILISKTTMESLVEPSYTILFDNGMTSSVPLSEMASIISSPPVREESPAGCNHLLPPVLQLYSKITFEHDGHYHKGFLGIRNGVYQFIYKSHVNKHKEDWGVDLPNLPQTWVDLCIEGIVLPGHVAHSFL